MSLASHYCHSRRFVQAVSHEFEDTSKVVSSFITAIDKPTAGKKVYYLSAMTVLS